MKNTCGADSCVEILLHPTTSSFAVTLLQPAPPFLPCSEAGPSLPTSHIFIRPVLPSLWRPLLVLGFHQTPQLCNICPRAEKQESVTTTSLGTRAIVPGRRQTQKETEESPLPSLAIGSIFLHLPNLVWSFSTFVICLVHWT